jgi:hypothetical protein
MNIAEDARLRRTISPPSHYDRVELAAYYRAIALLSRGFTIDHSFTDAAVDKTLLRHQHAVAHKMPAIAIGICI